jgi:hypothetical protein
MQGRMVEIQNVLLDNLETILEDVRHLNERQWLESPKVMRMIIVDEH